MEPTQINQIETITKIVAPLGVGGLLAAFMFVWYRRDMLDRITQLRADRERDAGILKSVTEALDRSTDAHEKAIAESARNRQLFLDLRDELRVWRQGPGNRRVSERREADSDDDN